MTASRSRFRPGFRPGSRSGSRSGFRRVSTRPWRLACAAALLVPLAAAPLAAQEKEAAPAAAQEGDTASALAAEEPGLLERLSVMPFFAWAAGYERAWTVHGPDGARRESERAPSSVPAGFALRYGLGGGLALDAGLLHRPSWTEYNDCEGRTLCQAWVSSTHPALTTLRLGLAWSPPLGVPVHVSAGPLLLREQWNGWHPGLSLGTFVELPTPISRLGLELGAEDQVIFWRAPERDPGYRVETEASHLPVLRAGLTLRR
ncbi:MAG TPA: hypothetical protein VMK65_05460 [Longimicrobiales bacterium]|nr:hypothetical protein [Longimicrobiales bacterium]